MPRSRPTAGTRMAPLGNRGRVWIWRDSEGPQVRHTAAFRRCFDRI